MKTIYPRRGTTSRRLATLAFLAAIAVTTAVAADFMPLLHNYLPVDYGAALQNWDISQGPNGEMYVGNGKGLLRYDGYTWSLTKMPDNGVARSVKAIGNRVYAGGYREFGYFEATSTGALVYTSLWPRDYIPHEDEIWNIVADHKGRVYFQSFSGWFMYDGKHVHSHFDQKLLPLYFHEIGGQVYMQAQHGDYYILTEDQHFRRLFTRQDVGDDNVVAAVQWSGNRLMLLTQWHGLYLYDNGTVRRFATDADNALRTANLNRGALLASDSLVVVGTILDGIFGVGSDGKTRWHFNQSNNLNNNSVLDLFADVDGNLWAALDIGIALIYAHSPFSLLYPGHAGPTIGMVYDVMPTDDGIYIASNQAAWRFDNATGTITRIAGTDGQNWHIANLGNDLVAGGNEVTSRITGNTAHPLPGSRSGSTCMHFCRIHGEEFVLESSYYSLRVYRRGADGWALSHDVEGFHAPVGQFEVDHSGNVWMSHMSKGLYRARLSKDLRHATVKGYNVLDGDSAMGVTHVMKIRGRVVFSRNQRLYTYDDLRDSVVRYNELDSLVHGTVCSATHVDENTFWLATENNFVLIEHTGDKYRVCSRVADDFFDLNCNEVQNHVTVKDGITYFNLNNGVGRLDLRRLEGDTIRNGRKLLIASVEELNKHAEHHMLPIASTNDDPTVADGVVTFTLSYPNYTFRPLRFRYSIDGAGMQVDSVSELPTIALSMLSYGKYHIHATVETIDGVTLGQVDYYVVRKPPFYNTWWAWACYLALLAAGVYALVRYRTRKTEEKLRKQFEDRKLQQDYAQMEQEKVNAEQRQQMLQEQLSDTSREMATLALDAMARNRAIDNIRETLLEKRRKGAITQAEMNAMLSQLGQSADNDNFWELYQQHFNLIQNDFFKRLCDAYPSLTPTDLRFCALLRLNQTTKEIARFTGLSVRGVEGARYRLRKKLGLADGDNLVDFLINFK